MISVLLPTRNRSLQLWRMIESVRATSQKHVEILLYIDNDDTETFSIVLRSDVRYKIGPRLREITQCWNELVLMAKGDILCQGNDDILFKTPAWDVLVEREFKACQDKILMVHGDDAGGQRERFGPHPFVHRKWVEAVGYFIPPWFSSDFGDTWLNDIANELERRRYLPFVVEHNHYVWRKAAVDGTTRERLQRHREDQPSKMYDALAPMRRLAVARLRKVMST